MADTRTMQNAWGLLFLRLSTAAMLLLGHGWDKLAHLAENAAHFPDPLGLGSAFSMVLVIFAEVVCTVLVIVGFWTRLAAMPVIVSMGIAAMLVHAGDPWHAKEFALLYAVPFVTLLVMGPGRFSIDHLRRRRARAGHRRIFRPLHP